MKKLLPSKKIFVADSKVTGAGRGVFAAENLKRGEIIEIAPVVPVPELPELDFPIKKTNLYHYYFRWGEKNKGTIGIGLGFASLYNHSFEPNITYRKRLGDNVLEFVALKDIRAGVELRMNYNYGDPRNKTPLWIKGIKPEKEKILPKEFVEALKIIVPLLKNVKEKWAVVGTTNLAIRGMTYKPNDIDIVTTLKGQKEIIKCLTKFKSGENIEKEGLREDHQNYFEQKFLVCNVEVSVMGEPDNDVYSKRLKEELDYILAVGEKIYLMPLLLEAEINKELGRTEKAAAITKYYKGL
jgi:hypothetical protein